MLKAKTDRPDTIMPLALRPNRLSDLVGQSKLVGAIRGQIASKRIPRAWLFGGASGTGKTTLARIVSVAVQCKHQPIKTWGDPCRDCLKHAARFDVLEVNASELNGVDDMAKVSEWASYQPLPPTRRRVIILDEAQMLSGPAQNLLLKPLEDTPRTTVWIICTTAPAKLLPTLRRRCVAYQVPGLSFAAQGELVRLSASRIGFTRPLAPLVECLHQAQVSAPGMILMALEKVASGLPPEEAVYGCSMGAGDAYRVCLAVTSGHWAEVKEQLSQATEEDCRWIRASVAGWLRGMLMKESSPSRRDALARAILEIIEPAPFEGGSVLLSWLVARLHRVCRLLTKA